MPRYAADLKDIFGSSKDIDLKIVLFITKKKSAKKLSYPGKKILFPSLVFCF